MCARIYPQYSQNLAIYALSVNPNLKTHTKPKGMNEGTTLSHFLEQVCEESFKRTLRLSLKEDN